MKNVEGCISKTGSRGLISRWPQTTRKKRVIRGARKGGVGWNMSLLVVIEGNM